jgi:hypothetical protein
MAEAELDGLAAEGADGVVVGVGPGGAGAAAVAEVLGGGAGGEVLNLETEMAEGESAAVIGPTKLPASRVASSYRCNRCEPESLVEPSTTPSSSLSIPVSRIKPVQREGCGENATSCHGR